MPQLTWKQLDREQARKMVDYLTARRDALVFSRDYTEVSTATLPFYENYWVVRLVNYATMPTFTMMYLSNGEDYIPLDGTANPIYTVNEKSPIAVSEENAAAYLDFFFTHVQGSEGEVLLIKDPSRSVFVRTLNDDQRAHIGNGIRPLTVAKDSAGNIRIRATIYYGHELITSTVMVHPDGKISFHDQQPLLAGIYLPETIYAQARAEG